MVTAHIEATYRGAFIACAVALFFRRVFVTAVVVGHCFRGRLPEVRILHFLIVPDRHHASATS